MSTQAGMRSTVAALVDRLRRVSNTSPRLTDVERDLIVAAAPTLELLVTELEVARAHNGMLRRKLDKEEAAMSEVLIERDEAIGAADSLVVKLSTITGIDYGEHTSSNDPWANALRVEEPEEW